MSAKAKKAPKKAAVRFPVPKLAKGEHYAGIIVEAGKPKHHLILLPGELARGTHAEAEAFAKKAGGALPMRREQALLFANAKEQFQGTWYWSGEQHAEYPDYAWSQYFDNGFQGWGHVNNNYRARAVRRLSIR